MIDFQNLTKSYMGMSPVLNNVQFHIGKGEFFYLTGVSGAGKTTVFKLLLAMEQPDAGEVLFDGAPLGRPNPRQRALHRRRIGMVFQDYRLLNRESVEDNVALPMRVAGLRSGVIRRRVTALLEQVGLQERRRESAMVLSGGEKQLVSIARALTLEPPVVLADEPTGNLDHAMAMRVMELLRAIHATGCTVVVATHDINLIRASWARTLLIKDKAVHEVRLTGSPVERA